jgi:putative hydrolase of the HAD superfamily
MLRYIPDAKKQKLIDLRKAGYRTFLLSNTIDLHWRYCCENLFAMGPYSVDDYFERTFVSQEMHMKSLTTTYSKKSYAKPASVQQRHYSSMT